MGSVSKPIPNRANGKTDTKQNGERENITKIHDSTQHSYRMNKKYPLYPFMPLSLVEILKIKILFGFLFDCIEEVFQGLAQRV